jgi:hypothetical protein
MIREVDAAMQDIKRYVREAPSLSKRTMVGLIDRLEKAMEGGKYE